MKENKALEFVIDFNYKLEKLNSRSTPYNFLQNKTDGFTEYISIPEINIYNDEDYNSEFVSQSCSAQLVLALNNMLEMSKKMLNKYVKEFVEELCSGNSIIKYKLCKKNTTEWELRVDEKLEELIWDNDFEYTFPGCKLRVVGDDSLSLALPDELEIGMYCVTKYGKTVQIVAHDMRDYPYVCFERMATNKEIEEYKKNKR